MIEEVKKFTPKASRIPPKGSSTAPSSSFRGEHGHAMPAANGDRGRQPVSDTANDLRGSLLRSLNRLENLDNFIEANPPVDECDPEKSDLDSLANTLRDCQSVAERIGFVVHSIEAKLGICQPPGCDPGKG